MRRALLAMLLVGAAVLAGGQSAQAAGEGQPTDWNRFYYYPYVYYPHHENTTACTTAIRRNGRSRFTTRTGTTSTQPRSHSTQAITLFSTYSKTGHPASVAGIKLQRQHVLTRRGSTTRTNRLDPRGRRVQPNGVSVDIVGLPSFHALEHLNPLAVDLGHIDRAIGPLIHQMRQFQGVGGSPVPQKFAVQIQQ